MNDYMVQETSGPMMVRYRRIVVWVHWVTALLLVVQIYIGFTFGDLPRGSPERAWLFGWHKSLGALILLLAVVRLAVRLLNPPPPYSSDYAKWKRFVAVWSHRLFYLLLFALPLTGLAAVSGRAEGGWVPLQLGLWLPAIPGVGAENGFGEIHELLVWLTLALLALHVSAALYNHFFDRGPVAGRMWPFRRSRAS